MLSEYLEGSLTRQKSFLRKVTYKKEYSEQRQKDKMPQVLRPRREEVKREQDRK